MAFLGDEAAVARYRDDYDAMRKRVNAVAWDGDWYVRYFDFDGSPLGSHVNEQGKIYINGQSWPVISGFATPERAVRSLDAVKRMLDTGAGIKISAPGFDGFDPAKGGVTTYPPGAKENGGIFLHTNPWVIIAETLVGRGEQAYAYYSQINPAARNDRLDEFECEPYVLSAEHPGRRASPVRPGAQQLALRDGLVDAPGRHGSHSRHPAGLWRAGNRSLHPGGLGRLSRPPRVSRGGCMRSKCAIRTTSTRASNR